MSKKKSYMDKENIVSEGFYTKLLSLFVPKSIKKSIDKVKLKALEKKIEGLDKYIKQSKKRQDAAQEEMLKAIEKETGQKIKRYKSAKDRINAFYEKGV
jgi:predicted nucleotidyltransferase